MIRNKIFLKTIAVFLLVTFLQSLFMPQLAKAITGGPVQAEYTGYESVGSTDMVNLATGDFTYNIPLIDIPSPEGGFTMPLSYHAGITGDEEASWVGLGWSLNPGAITRNVSQYPDDFSGQSQTFHASAEGSQGFYVNFLVGSYFYDSEKGGGGTIGIGDLLSLGFGNQAGITAVGVTVNEEGINADAVGVMTSVMTVIAAAFTFGASSAASEAVQVTKAFTRLLDAASTAISVANIAYSLSSGGSKVNSGDWTLSKQNFFFYGDYRSYLNVSKSEIMIGALYLQDMPQTDTDIDFENGGTTDKITAGIRFSDMHSTSAFSPSSIAWDNYSVMGEGVSGNIKPYRFETGSLIYPGEGVHRYVLAPFLDYKPQFRYLGDIANQYTYHNSGNFGISASYHDNTPYVTFSNMDATLFDASSMEQSRYGFNKDRARLTNARYIEWFKNAEITNGSAINKGFLDYKADHNRSNLPGKGIGGFAITRQDGMTYHYALPVYNTLQYSFSGTTESNASLTSASDFATTWLLTAITGPDFIDRNENGMADENDWGYWVKFDYGKFASGYFWHNPYENDIQNVTFKSFVKGLRESYYLNKITTRTHTALFIKSLRQDGRGWFETNFPDIKVFPSSSLKLDEIILLANKDYNSLGLQNNLGNSDSQVKNGDTFENVLDAGDISTAMRDALTDKQLKRVKFNYYAWNDTRSLCYGTLNSYASAANAFNISKFSNSDGTKGGKLTLQSVSIFGVDNIKMMPDYLFEYGSNPNYGTHQWDGWGMYNPQGIDDDNYHHATGDGSVWSLKEITTPTGSKISVQYERDSYVSVSGEKPTTKVQIRTDNFGTDANGNINRLYTTVDYNLMDYLKAGDVIDLSLNADETKNVFSFFCNPNTGEPVYTVYETSHEKIRNLSCTIASVGSNYIDLVTPVIHKQNGVLSNGTNCGGVQYPAIKYIWDKITWGMFTADLPDRNIPGGDIRVSTLISKDENGNQYKTRYLYTQDETENGLTSGGCSIEPQFIKGKTQAFEEVFDFPFTPIMYGKVTVLEGRLNNVNDFTSKTVYEFKTPDKSMVELINPPINTSIHEVRTSTVIQTPLGPATVYTDPKTIVYEQAERTIKINTLGIGSLLSLKKYDKTGNLVFFQQIEYTDNSDNSIQAGMGIYTEGSIITERPLLFEHLPSFHDKLVRTTKIYYPSILTKVTTTQDGVTTELTNVDFDFLTGSVISKQYENSFGDKYLSMDVPAYHMYPEMGSKAENDNNKNMMSQQTANYIFKEDYYQEFQNVTITSSGNNLYHVTITDNNKKLPPNYGAKYGPWVEISGLSGSVQIVKVESDRKSFDVYYTGSTNITGTKVISLYPRPLLAAGIRTWNKSWQYRELDANTNTYENQTSSDVWRTHKKYIWKSAVNTDGTFTSFNDFNWSDHAASEAAGWQKASQVIRYDHYSKPLETIDINGNAASMKMGYNESAVLASASNATFTEFAYSGAEDPLPFTNYFGGEVSKGGGSVSTTVAHTGNSSVQTPKNNTGFNYEKPLGNNGFRKGKIYRAQVWLHQSNATSGMLYYHLEDNNNNIISQSGVTITSANTVKAGAWYLLTLDIPIPNSTIATILEIGAWNNPLNNNPVFFDDFRVYPLGASMTANVYDPKTGELTYTLDNEHFYTRFKYSETGRGKITETYKETLNGEKIVSKTQNHYGRQN